jgi:PAS domain S-box-containing protein
VRLWRRVGTPLAGLAEQARQRAQREHTPVAPSGIAEVEALRVALDEAATHERVRHEAEREREEARRELRQSEQRFRAIFEDAAVGIIEVDDEGRIVAANGRFAAMLGYARDELLGRTIHELTAPEDAEITRRQNAAGRAGELGTFEYEKRYLRRDGSRIWVHVHVAIVRDQDGRFLRAVGTASDITDRRRAQDALREADRRKDEFLGMLSHELRNPLAPIRSSVHILRRADPAGAQAARARAVIERQSEHLTRIVDDLLDVTRIVRGKILLHRERVDLREVVRRAVEDAHLSTERREVALRLNLPPRPLRADADATRITQIIGNLLANARKFTQAGDEIVVTLREVDGTAELTVRDTGAGIDPALLPRLFEAFVQGERTLARSEGGLGLGLALVKGLAELHDGAVTAHSEGVGKGAAFVVTLPLAGPSLDDEHTRPAAHPAPAAARRVLVVDDNADAAESLAELVGLFGHSVEVAFDGPSAIAKVRQRRPDVVLCDIGLPGMTGYDVARALRAELDGAIRLVAVSGYAQPDDVKNAEDAGFDAHLAKPADPERIAELIG